MKLDNQTYEKLVLYDAIWETQDSASAMVPDERKAVHDMPVRKHDSNLYKKRPLLEPFFSPIFYYNFLHEIESTHLTKPRSSRGKPALFNGLLYFRTDSGDSICVETPKIKLYPPGGRQTHLNINDDDETIPS